VVLALMLGRPADKYLDAQRAAHLQRMRELTGLKHDSDQVGVLLADHALYQPAGRPRGRDRRAATAAVAARLALHRVHISPLGVARRTTPKPPRAWRVVPLLAGLAELAYWTVHGHPVPAGVVSCAQLAAIPALGRCPAGAATAAFPADGFNGPLSGIDATTITWPAANVPASRLDTLGVDAINVGADGTMQAIEQARTVLENTHAYPAVSTPSTIGDIIAQDNSTNNDYQQLADTVILVSLPIAGCTLAAGIATGLADRKRPFSMLRLTGARLAMLRRVVALEGAVPLLAVAAGAAMFASEAQQHPMVAPGAAYYLPTAGGILAALGIIAATFPLLARITGPEVARNE
jgi:hypothetical protein